MPTNTSIKYGVTGLGCVHWSRRTTSLPAAPCMMNELVWVETPKGKKLMCRVHRNDYSRTGVIRGKLVADKPYSTAMYRPTPAKRRRPVS